MESPRQGASRLEREYHLGTSLFPRQLGQSHLDGSRIAPQKLIGTIKSYPK